MRNSAKTSSIIASIVIFVEGMNTRITVAMQMTAVIINALLRQESAMAFTLFAASPSWNFGLSRTPNIIFLCSGFLGNPRISIINAEGIMQIANINLTNQSIKNLPFNKTHL